MHDPEDWGSARNVDHIEAALNEERRKFQQETLRTSALMQMLEKWANHAWNQGCRTELSPKSCYRCRLLRETRELLDKPINAGTGGGNDAQG